MRMKDLKEKSEAFKSINENRRQKLQIREQELDFKQREANQKYQEDLQEIMMRQDKYQQRQREISHNSYAAFNTGRTNS